VLLGRTRSKLEGVAAGLGRGTGLPVVCDVGDAGQISDAVAKVVAHFGGVQVLVNAAPPSASRTSWSTLSVRCSHSFRATSGPVIRFRSGNVEAMIASEAASPPRTVAQ
jgi:NAD(P)-dependent dehydrogenase (short-subunit alcohol dehydrogenase family)